MTAGPRRLDAGVEGRVLELWARALVVDVAALDVDGTVVVQDPREHAAERRGTIDTARGTIVLVAPGDDAADPEAFAADVGARATDAVQLSYLAAAPSGVANERVSLLGEEHRPLLDELHRSVGKDAVAEAEVDVAHAVAVGIVEDGRLLAIATLLEEDEDVADIGVLVAPAQRRQGLASAVVGELVRRATAEGMLLQYRCRPGNDGSAAVARACGFALWGVLTVARRPR